MALLRLAARGKIRLRSPTLYTATSSLSAPPARAHPPLSRSVALPTASSLAMIRQKITMYAMLTLKRWIQIKQEIRARRATRAARIAAGLPPDLLEAEEEEAEAQQADEEEEEEQQPASMEVATPEEGEEEELASAPGFNIEDAEAFAVLPRGQASGAASHPRVHPE